MAKVILEAKAISKSFGKPILSKVDLMIREGETHVIMGKSGEGKSTLLKILAGLTSVDRGRVEFEGDELENPEEVLVAGHDELAYVAQSFNLLRNRTVLENLKDSLLAFKDEFASNQINQLLQLMRLEELKEHKIESLSGGEKQRLAIARALATQPAVLLLDEPFTQLDFPTRQILLNAIKAVKEELDTSIVLVSHNLYEAFYLADIIHILKGGALIKSSKPMSIYENPEFVSVANILGDVNLLPKGALGRDQNKLMGVWGENLLIEHQESAKYHLHLELIGKIYLGDYFRYQFQLDDQHTIIVKSDDPSFSLGEYYTVSFEERYLFELKAD